MNYFEKSFAVSILLFIFDISNKVKHLKTKDMKTSLIITIISVLLATLAIVLFNQGCPQALILIAVIPFLYIIFCEDKDSLNYKRRKGIQ